MKKIFATLLIFSLTLCFGVAPLNLTMTDVNGTKYTIINTEEGFKIKGFENRIIFLEFFGHHCPPCIESIPHLISLQKKYKDKLTIFAIEVQGYNSAQLKQFANYKKMNYIVISEETTRRFVQVIQQRAQWRGSIPFLVALDKNSDVQYVQAGLIPQNALENLIKRLDSVPLRKKLPLKPKK